MTKKEMEGLKKGNFVTPSFEEETYVVLGNYGSRVTVASYRDISNPYGWLMCVDEKFIRFKKLNALMIGDIVRSILTDMEYVITSKYINHATAIRTMDITYPEAWSKI